MLFCFTRSARRLINWAPKMRSAVGGDQLNISVARSGSYVDWRTGRQSALGQRDEQNKMQCHTAKWWLLSSHSARCRATLILRLWKAPWGRAQSSIRLDFPSSPHQTYCAGHRWPSPLPNRMPPLHSLFPSTSLQHLLLFSSFSFSLWIICSPSSAASSVSFMVS